MSEDTVVRPDPARLKAARSAEVLVEIEKDFERAWESCTPYLASRLSAHGRRGELDAVKTTLRTELWSSLANWDKAGRPPLGAWAGGIAKKVLSDWGRKDKPRGDVEHVVADDVATIEFALPVVFDGAVGEDDNQQDFEDVLLRAVYAVKTIICARPGGHALWRQVLFQAQNPSERSTLNEDLRVFVTTVASGENVDDSHLEEILLEIQAFENEMKEED